jgi:hypothetical protein
MMRQPMNYSDDIDKEVAVTVAQFVLKPDIPIQERAYFQRFYVMFSKISALGFIQREDILSFKLTFKMVAILLENGIYDYAHELMADFLMTLQLSRSVGGFWTLYGQQGVQRSETIERIKNRAKRQTFGSRVKSALLGTQEDTDSQGVIDAGEMI